MKIYQDSKELPLFNYERITETEDYLYMIKGYDGTQEYDINPQELKEKFSEIVKHFSISINAKNLDIVNYGKAQKSYLEIARLELLYNIISLKIKENELREKANIPIDNTDIKEALKQIKIPKTEDLRKQLEIISDRIAKHQNDMAVTLSKIKKEEPNGYNSDINEIITNVELILERTIDMDKTTLYRFGIMQKQAIKKIEYQQKQLNSRK